MRRLARGDEKAQIDVQHAQYFTACCATKGTREGFCCCCCCWFALSYTLWLWASHAFAFPPRRAIALSGRGRVRRRTSDYFCSFSLFWVFLFWGVFVSLFSITVRISVCQRSWGAHTASFSLFPGLARHRSPSQRSSLVGRVWGKIVRLRRRKVEAGASSTPHKHESFLRVASRLEKRGNGGREK